MSEPRRSEADSSRPLAEVLNALVGEFTRATVARDVAAAHMARVYDASPILREFTPSRVRVHNAKVTLPVAIEQVSPPQPVDAGLTAEDLADIMPAGLDAKVRAGIARTLIRDLDAGNRVLDPGLTDRVAAASKKRDAEIDRDKLEAVRQALASRPMVEQSVRVLYRAAELEKLPPERIVKIELDIGVE